MSEIRRITQLKAELMTEGLAIDPSVREVLAQNGEPITLADYASTSGITLELENDAWVNAPIADFNANFVEVPNNELRRDQDELYITGASGDFAAKFIPVPAYYDKELSDGTPITQIAVTHADRLRISPTIGCTFKCRFCDLPYETKYHGVRSLEMISEATQVAMADTRLSAEHILVSGGVPALRDYGAELDVYEHTIAENPDVDVDIMMAPVERLLDLERLKKIGAAGLSVNMELWNIEMADKIMPSKMRLSREQYLDFIERAVEVFGRGAVRSALLVGLESMDDTLAGVEALAQRGADPMLSPFRPSPITPLANFKPPTTDQLVETYLRSQELVEKYDVKLGPRCIPCGHNVMVVPDDSGDYYYSRRRS
jgi:hypothetical protein